jgi:hypothetical protein
MAWKLTRYGIACIFAIFLVRFLDKRVFNAWVFVMIVVAAGLALALGMRFLPK